MRKIKLRAWLKDKKKMLYQSDNTASMMNGLEGFVQIVGSVKGYTPEIMQFTGLLDTNDKEIYEGDLIQMAPNGHEPRKICEVIWNEALLQWSVKNSVMLWAFSNPIVVGNVHENPKLLAAKVMGHEST